MPNLFPYTNTHELNLDWILQVVRDFQTKYTTFDQALADALEAIQAGKTEALDEISTDLTAALNDIEASQTAALTAIGNTKDSALADIATAYTTATNAISALNTTVQNEITTLRNTSLSEISAAQTAALAVISAEQLSATQTIVSLYNTLPTSAQDILNRLDILNTIITGNTPNAFVWLQGSYTYPEGETPPTPPVPNYNSENYNYRVTSRYLTGAAGRRLRVVTDGTIIISSLLYWYNTPPGGQAYSFTPGDEGITETTIDRIVRFDSTALSIELKKADLSAITPNDVDGHIYIEWVTDFVGQRIIAPKESSTTADVARLAGEYFFLDGDLYIATAPISVGDTIAEGTNCEKKTVGGELSDLKSAFNRINKNVFSIKTCGLKNGYINNSGSLTVNASYRTTDYIPIKSGESFAYKLSHATTLPIIAFYNASKVYDSTKSVIGVNGYSTGTYTATADGYIRLIFYKASDDVSVIFTEIVPDNVQKKINEVITNNIPTLETKLLYEDASIYKKVYAIKSNGLKNGFINNGSLTGNALYRTTDYLPIKSGESFDYRLSHGSSALPVISFYNTSKVYDSTKSVMGANTAYVSGTYTATADGYIRMTYLNSLDDVWAIFTSVIPDNVVKAFPSNGVKKMKILCLGDSIFGESTEVTAPLQEFTGATIINGAVPGTRASNRGGTDKFQYFDGVNLIDALCTNTWTDQETAAEQMAPTYTWITSKLETLENVNMSEIDIITFNWGTNDYTGGVALADIISAQNYIINTILTSYPTIRIVIITPLWRYFNTEENGDNKVFNDATLKQISNSIIENAIDKRITVFNSYANMPLNYKTALSYYDTGSGVHLNSAGGRLFAHYINGFIQSIC